MFLNDRLVYLQMQKTASTHITRRLAEIAGGTSLTQHSKLKEDPGGRAVLGSVRNPWDWYVSLWSFGCAGKGALFHHLTTPTFGARSLAADLRSAFPSPAKAWWTIARWRRTRPVAHAMWRRLYGDVGDPRLFREWLMLLVNPEPHPDLPEGYPASSVARFAGFMTYRFFALYTRFHEWQRRKREIVTPSELGAFWESHAILQHCIRMEHLEDDLAEALGRIGYAVSPGSDASRGKTNTSQHLDFRAYYDEATENRVLEFDRFIVDRFAYVKPSEDMSHPAAS